MNNKLKETLKHLESNKYIDSLQAILTRQEESTNIQLSAVKILNFLVNDMLDYAQFSAGQFRKFITKFNLNEAVTEIFNILHYKATEMGIEL